MDKAIITAASNKYFPSVLNLLGSIKANSPDHPQIFVYDLGLLKTFRRELELVEGVKVITMPAFCSFWRSCYTWKTYILAHPLANLNFYLDAGCQVLRPLDAVFEGIEKNDYFLVYQHGTVNEITPSEYKVLFNLDKAYDSMPMLHAGVIGFKKDSPVTPVLNKVYVWARAGLALGFSKGDLWRNRGKDKTNIVRSCPFFRHDLTLLNIALRQAFEENLVINSEAVYAGKKDADPKQVIWNFRLVYWSLDYIHPKFLHKKISLQVLASRVLVRSILIFKNIWLFSKRILGLSPQTI